MEQSQKINTKYRIGNLVGLILILVAILIDVIEFILGVTGVGEIFGYILDVIKIVCIPIMFVILSVSPVKPSRLKILSITFFVGLIPYVGSFVPETAAGVYATIKNSRKEDVENIKLGVGVKKDKLVTRVKKSAEIARDAKLPQSKVTRTKRSSENTSGGNRI